MDKERILTYIDERIFSLKEKKNTSTSQSTKSRYNSTITELKEIFLLIAND